MSISIEYDNPQALYFPGSEVSGVAILNLDSAVKARSVCIFVKGLAHTHWSETRTRTVSNGKTSGSSTYTVSYQASVIYVNGEAVVWSDTPGHDSLPPGQHRYPFRFHLPPHSPPSFEATFGYIRYHVSIEIDRKWKFNKTNRRIFTVAPILDLNAIPQAILPVENTKSKNTGIVLFRNGNVSIEAKIPKMGFVPGEDVIAECIVTNDSSKKITLGEIQFVQLARFTATPSRPVYEYTPGMKLEGYSHTREESREAAIGGQLLDIGPHSKATVHLGVKVPSTVASINACPIISVEYYVAVNFSSSGKLNSTIRVPLPILIGTVPVAPNPQSVAPPTYEETVFGGSGTVKDVFQGEQFAPLYPVYHNLPVSVMPSAPPADN